MTITLQIRRGEIPVLDTEIAIELVEGLAMELQPIIRYQGLQHSKSCYYISPYKLLNVYIPDINQSLDLRQLSEVVHGYKNKSSVSCSSRERTNDI